MSEPAQKLKTEETASPQAEFVENRRILVVEDETSIAESYVQILAPSTGKIVPLRRSSRSAKPSEGAPKPAGPAKGFEIVVVHNAKDALTEVERSLAEKKPFAMGFFDVLLGDGIDGIELVKKIYEIDSEIYAVFVTAYHDRGVDSIAEYLGETAQDRWDYLNKPFSEGEILQKARNSVALWNLRKIKTLQENRLAESSQRVMMNDRMNSVAAVARGVAHEFGNILMQITGRAELSQDGNPEQMKKALGTILSACETASSILDNFKNLARPSESLIKKENIWAHAPLEEALDLMSHTFSTANIQVCRIKNDKVKINASHASLVQVFMNLLINAQHAMGGGPGQIDLSIKKEKDGVEIKVRDYGPGIPKELLSKVTEAFFTTKGDKGTGIGLSICREIVEIDHCGKFDVHNHPMKGAEFILWLPVDPVKESNG